MPLIPQSDALSEASPSSVQDLFNKKPPLPQSDIDTLIIYYRKLRDDLASSTTVRHTRVKRDKEETIYTKADFSRLLDP